VSNPIPVYLIKLFVSVVSFVGLVVYLAVMLLVKYFLLSFAFLFFSLKLERNQAE